MIYELFLFSSVWIWLLLFGLASLATLLMEVELGKASGGVVAGIFALLVAFTSVGDWVSAHWIVSLFGLLPGYFALGVVWAWFKWRGYILGKMNEAKAYVGASFNDRTDKSLTFYAWLVDRKYIPTPGMKLDLLASWISAWPMGLIWEGLSVPRMIADQLLHKLTGFFTRVSEKIVASFEPIPVPPPVPVTEPIVTTGESIPGQTNA